MRIRNLILDVKRHRIDPTSGRAYSELIIERIAARLTPDLRALFEGAFLIPVPGAGLTKPNTVWPARNLADALVGQSLGVSVLAVLKRVQAVRKSAGNTTRPSLDTHLGSFAVQGEIRDPSRITLIDDVVTRGTTLLAAARIVQ